MKKILIIIAILILIFGFVRIKEWYNNNEKQKADLISRNLDLEKVVQEDSTTISIQVTEIRDGRVLNNVQSRNLINVRKKYGTLLDSYIKLEIKIDSLKSDSVTTEVIIDSADSTQAYFQQSIGGGLFQVYGHISRTPLYVYGLGISQKQPIFIEATIERLKNDDYISYVTSNIAGIIKVKARPVKVLDKRRFIDRVWLTAHLATITFGVGIGAMYKSYGLSYYQFIDGGALMFNYMQNLGEIF